MKIVHLCLACFFIEGMEYQENVLPRKHKQLGHDVEVITSQYCFDNKGRKFERPVEEYVNRDGVKVSILPYSDKYGILGKRYRIFDRLDEILEERKPDVIFCHGAQFHGVGKLIKYLKNNQNVKLYVDSHADYRTGPVNTYKKKMMQRYLWGRQYRRLEPYAVKIWGTHPARVKYLKDIYMVKSDKVDLLIMGGDVDCISLDQRAKIRSEVRKKYNIGDSTFLITTGGKIDFAKKIHLLMKAVYAIKDKDMKLLVFGEPSDNIKEEIESLAKSENIEMIGWLQPQELYSLFYAADLAVFPGTHSVVWENACACGLPAVFRATEGEDHIDMGGNCLFLHKDCADEMEGVLRKIIDDKQLYYGMREVAIEKGYKTFSYMEIAKKAIGL